MRHFEFITEAVDPEAIAKEKKKLAAEIKKIDAKMDDHNSRGEPQPVILSKKRKGLVAQISFLDGQLEIAAQGGDTLDSPDSKSLPAVMPPRNKHAYKRWQESMKPAVEKIKRDCKPFLNEIGNDLSYAIYRGIKGSNAHAMTGRVRLQDRKPMGTGHEIHDYLNDYFTQAFGAPFRSAMFVSGSANFAKDYGNLFLVFPVGEFEYIWSPHVTDLYYLEDDMDEALYGDQHEPEAGTGDVANFTRLMKGMGYINTDLESAAESKNEIMVRCKFYHGINLTEFFGRQDDDDDDYGNVDTLDKAVKLIQELL